MLTARDIIKKLRKELDEAEKAIMYLESLRLFHAAETIKRYYDKQAETAEETRTVSVGYNDWTNYLYIFINLSKDDKIEDFDWAIECISRQFNIFRVPFTVTQEPAQNGPRWSWRTKDRYYLIDICLNVSNSQHCEKVLERSVEVYTYKCKGDA